MIQIFVMSSGSDLVRAAIDSIENQKPPQQDFSYEVIYNSSEISRESALLGSSANWVLLLDEDCRLPHREYLCNLEQLVLANPEGAIWGGLYLNPESASYSIRAYNSLCNAWVLLSTQGDHAENLLGGCLLVNLPKTKQHIRSNPIPWGGEDTFFLRALQREGLHSCYSAQLNVVHDPGPQNLFRVATRARLHGLRRRQYRLASSYPRWLRNADVVINSFRFWPFWFVHFLFLAMGSIVPRPAPLNKLQQFQ